MMNRETYCKNCDRSIYCVIDKYCNYDINIEDNGIYVTSAKIINREMEERDSWKNE